MLICDIKKETAKMCIVCHVENILGMTFRHDDAIKVACKSGWRHCVSQVSAQSALRWMVTATQNAICSGGRQGHPRVQILSFACNLWQKMCKIIYFGNWHPLLKKILDPPLRGAPIPPFFLWRSSAKSMIYVPLQQVTMYNRNTKK